MLFNGHLRREQMSLVKRLSVFALAVTTVLWSVGASVAPVNAASYGAGSLLALQGASDAAVYYIGSDGMKYVFPDAKTYHTWYENFDDVVRVSVDVLDEYEDGGAVTYRPGTKLVTHMNTAKVYAVGPGGELHWIPSEAVATDLYGTGWGAMVMDVIPGYFSSSYTTGSDLSNMYPSGTLVQMGETIYYIDGTSKRAFANADAFEANNFSYSNVLDVDDLSAYTNGDSITGEEMALSGYMPGESDGDDDVTPGSLTVSVASDTPNPGVVPSKAAGVEWAKFKLKAGANGATVDSLTVLRNGVGPSTDFQAVYLYEGDERLTSGKTVNSSSHEVVFNNLDLEFSANQTRYVSLVVDAGASKTGTHAFSVEEVDLSSGTASISNAMGNYITFSNNPAGYVTITEGSDPSNPAVGEQDVELTSFTLTTTDNDGSFEGISLYYAGAASRTDISNLRLYRNSMSSENLVASVDSLNSEDLAVFTLDTPYTLDKGTGVKFYVYGDIATGARSGSAETIKFYLDETSDISVIDEAYNFPMGVDNGIQSWDGGTGSGTYDGSAGFTTCYIDAADVTVTTDGPGATNVDAGSASADDINFLNFTMTVSQDVEVRNIQIELHQVGTDLDADDAAQATGYETVSQNYITDIKITNTDTNTVVWGPTDISGFVDAGAGNYNGVGKTWTDSYNLDAGTHHFKVTADLKNSYLDANSQFYVVLGDKNDGNTFTATSLKNVDNNTYITSIVPSSYTQGSNMTLKGPSLSVVRSTTPNSDDLVLGASGVTAANLIFSAEDSGADIKITSIKLSGYVDDDSRVLMMTKDQTGTSPYLTVQDLVSFVYAYAEQADGTETLVGTKSFDSSGEATFNSLNWSIPAGDTRNLRIVVDTNGGHTPVVGSTSFDAFAVDIADFSADVTAQTTAGTALTAAQMGTATYDNPNKATTSGQGPKFALYTGGALTVQNGPSKPAVSLVTTGSSDVYYHQLEVFTSYETLAISKMKFLAGGNFGNFASVKLSGKNSAGNSVSYTRSVDGSGYATFTGMDLKADEDGEYIDVYVTLNTVSNGANVGTASTWDLQTTGFEANGIGGSNTNLTSFTNSDSASNALYVVKSKPVFANAGSNGSLADGVNTLYKFTVTPSGEDKVAIKKLKFNVDSTGSALNLHSFRLYKGTSCTTAIDTAFFTGPTYGTTTGSLLNATTANYDEDTNTVYMYFEGASDSSYTDASDYNGELVVPVGGETYCLKATASGSATNTSVVTSIAEEGQDTTGPTYGILGHDWADLDGIVEVGTTAADIVWSDYASTTAHEDAVYTSSGDWYTGRYMPGLQSDATSLTKS